MESHVEWRWAFGFGLVAGLAALGVSAMVLRGGADDWRALVYSVGLAAFINGVFLWRLLMRRGGRRLLLRGTITGLLVVMATHILGWYFALLYFYITGQTGSLGDRTVDPLTGIPVAFGYGLLSLVLVGWMTVPLGSALGALWAYLEFRRFSDGKSV